MKKSTENMIICMLMLIAGNTSTAPWAPLLLYIGSTVSGIIALVYLTKDQ